ncbi:MAG TPA: hypothetical protein VG308_06850 [Stellaceae bacterium]|nr:hypothetical protein [Stellaceae bacterium]
MERNRWETALRCLEIAVHPNTSDKEALAAVNGFRRTAGGVSIAALSREVPELGTESAARGARAWHLLDRLDQLHQETRELRRRLAAAEASRAAALRQLADSQQRATVLAEELGAAERHADAAERRLAEFQGAYGRIAGGLSNENLGLRRALDEARRNAAQPIHEPVAAPFRAILDATLQRTEPPQPAAPAPAYGRLGTA